MKGKEMITTAIKTNNQVIPVQQRKQTRSGLTYLIASLVAIWLAETLFGRPNTLREIEI